MGESLGRERFFRGRDDGDGGGSHGDGSVTVSNPPCSTLEGQKHDPFAGIIQITSSGRIISAAPA